MIRRVAIVFLTSFFLVGILSSQVLAKSGQKLENVPVYCLSLGTSLAAGVQADPLTGVSIITDVSYPSELAEMLSQDIPKLRPINLGCPGETSATFIDGGLCDYPQGSQFDQAIQFLHAHGKFTGLITIDLGANDILQCVKGPIIDLDCIGQLLVQLPAELSYILETLREVAPGVPIVGMNYYNPLLVFWFQSPPLAQLTIALQNQINDALEDVYAAFGVPVADVAGVFMSDDLTTDNNGNFIPDSIDLLCAWTWMCEFQNIHANDTGYAVIAEEFVSVLPEIPISTPPRKRLKNNGRK
jgi:lysophospholipase L1-like esterase